MARELTAVLAKAKQRALPWKDLRSIHVCLALRSEIYTTVKCTRLFKTPTLLGPSRLPLSGSTAQDTSVSSLSIPFHTDLGYTTE